MKMKYEWEFEFTWHPWLVWLFNKVLNFLRKNTSQQ